MPEQEFEIYLTLLSRLLRLNPAQKAAISDELRDHLEERLETLIQEGASREQAIKAAMEEFGDVTGLALDLTKASRTPLRKIAVRSTIAVSAFAVLIVGWLTFFVPEHRIAAPHVVHADQPKTVEEQAKNVVVLDARAEISGLQDDELFPEFLAASTTVQFEDVPLHEACRFLEATHKVPVALHRSALADFGLDADLPVNLNLKEISFEEVLNQLTRKSGLAWHVDGGLVQISTTEQEESRYLTRQYDLSELVARGHNVKTILQILRMDTEKWQDVDGEGGTSAVVGESLIVSQTYHDQRRISLALAVINQPPESASLVGKCTGRDTLLAALQTPTSIDVDDIPLRSVIEMLTKSSAIQMIIDDKSLHDEGIDSNTPVTLHRHNRPLGKLLDDLLDELHLTYQLRDGVIQLTTPAFAESDLKMVAYNVQDLMVSSELFSQLQKAILQTTHGKWGAIDGEGGTLAHTDVGGILFVKQTDKVQAEVRSLIEQLQRTWKGRAPDEEKMAANAQATMIIKTYRMPKEFAADMLNILPKFVAPDTWKMGVPDGPIIEFVSSKPEHEKVDGLVTGGPNEIQVLNTNTASAANPAALKPGATSNVSSVVIRPRSSLIIRQTPEVHQQIQKFLTSLDVAFEVGSIHQTGGSGVSGFGNGGGGFGGGFGGGGGMGGGMF